MLKPSGCMSQAYVKSMGYNYRCKIHTHTHTHWICPVYPLCVCVYSIWVCIRCHAHTGQALVPLRKWDCVMEFLALGTWFIFHPGFLFYLQDFPRFWLQLAWEAGKKGKGSRALEGRTRRGGSEGGREARQNWSLSHTSQHSWSVGKRANEPAEIKDASKL